jgi:hypothetical protein
VEVIFPRHADPSVPHGGWPSRVRETNLAIEIQAVESPSNETRRSDVFRDRPMIAASPERAFQAVNTELIDLYWQLGATVSRKIKTHRISRATVSRLLKQAKAAASPSL